MSSQTSPDGSKLAILLVITEVHCGFLDSQEVVVLTSKYLWGFGSQLLCSPSEIDCLTLIEGDPIETVVDFEFHILCHLFEKALNVLIVNRGIRRLVLNIVQSLSEFDRHILKQVEGRNFNLVFHHFFKANFGCFEILPRQRPCPEIAQYVHHGLEIIFFIIIGTGQVCIDSGINSCPDDLVGVVMLRQI